MNQLPEKTPDITTERQSELLAQLAVLAAERAETERSLGSNRVARHNTANESFQSLREAEVRRHSETADRLNKERNRAIAEAKHVQTTALRSVEEDELRFERTAPREHQERLDALRRKAQQRTERSHEQLEQATAALKKQWLAFEQGWRNVEAQHQTATGEAQAEARRRRVELPPGDADAVPEALIPPGASPLAQAVAAMQASGRQLELLGHKASAKFFDEGWTVIMSIFLGLGGIYPAGHWLGWSNGLWVVVSVGGALALTGITRLLCGWRVKRHAREILPQAANLLQCSTKLMNRAWGQATEEAEGKRHRLKLQAVKEAQKIDETLREQLQLQQSTFDATAAEVRDGFGQRRREIQERLATQMQQIEQTYQPAIEGETGRHAEAMRKLTQDNREQLERSQRVYDEGMSQLVARWTKGLTRIRAEIDAMNGYCRQLFPAWQDIDWDQWQPPRSPAAAFPYGHYVIDIDQYSEPPEDPRLRLDEPRVNLPAALAFPQRPSLVLECSDEGKQIAVKLMQTLMLRMLMAVPPGKVRFTIIDPEALGQNFSAFMHLADFDEQIVGPRIWTEQQHIQQQLVDLTEHTENVIQKYLRNEFASIQEYNAHAGEVAEPYRILVVANFPEGFTEESARRLVSIASTGAKCGVFTLISIDTRKKLPRDFFIDELESHATTLQWTLNGFRPKDARLRALPFSIDSPPVEEAFTKAIRQIGRHVRDADRVEVPFELVAPEANRIWQSDCREELDVPLGRAGATKLQHLRLGKGVSQHVLISGKTGSGKSTLMHALITNCALHYSPEEVEFYLIDFKKGVEFKPYATYLLPHARVIAIESEREFGMSVLERLDEELRRRGDLFRAASVQDVRGFREACPDQPMPRTLLVIDEFQELFVKDDKIAADAALLLDRLVRQGRAFGIHVLLGSQTLAGGYSLPRSTIGQMAVRIALQCSESDAHLILSEDNTAARLLTRPGEAIYNNANGRFEGNSPFQVVFLSDSERVEQLQRVEQLAREQGTQMPAPIVFEGNVPANPLRTPELLEHMRRSRSGGETHDRASIAPPRAWLGAAVAIKPPTYCDFSRQSGANLLVVGPLEEMALGVLANAAISLGASSGVEVEVIDGTRPESGLAGAWQRLVEHESLGGAVRCHPLKATEEVLAKLAEERARRERDQDEHCPPRFLLLHNLSRFRDLRRSEDDYSFSFSDSGDGQAGKPDKLLQQLLREGPAHGIHVLVWADSFNTASRWFDRQTLKDFELRVLFQMTAADSANLMDSPAAAQLGMHRAILYTEEHGKQEKFRPFAPPDNAWIDWLSQLQAPDLTTASQGLQRPMPQTEPGDG
ncbi:MAG: hypothetical protein KDB14_32685 [Planctomycetales bacterium]|nr:hypothetical protein [Planctomycetales bacterium]